MSSYSYLLFFKSQIAKQSTICEIPQKEADERIKSEKKKEISEQLFLGISQIVDCFAICDLENNRYEYEDKRGEYLYPKKGFYDQFIKELSDQYTILTDGENAKFTNMLSVWNVRQLINGQTDSYCLEYCARDKSIFFIMIIIKNLLLSLAQYSKQ